MVFPQKEQEKITEEYTNGVTLRQICKNHNIKSTETIRNILRKNGVSIIGHRNRYPINEDYFNEIDSFDKAYWLGVLFADGTVSENRESFRLGMIDREHIDKYKKAIGAINHKIGTTVDIRFKEPSLEYHLGIRNKKMHNSLIRHGCVPNKTEKLKDFPVLPKNLYPHFLRGFFDGDGSIHKTNGHWRISFYGTHDFLQNILDYFDLNNLKVQPTSHKHYYIQIGSLYDIARVCNIMYENSTEQTRLDRKYNKYNQFLLEMGASLSNLEI